MSIDSWTSEGMAWEEVEQITLSPLRNRLEAIRKAIVERWEVVSVYYQLSPIVLPEILAEPVKKMALVKPYIDAIQSAVSTLIPNFINNAINGGDFEGYDQNALPTWTEETIIEAIGDDHRIELGTFDYIGSKWFWQQYKILNHLVWDYFVANRGLGYTSASSRVQYSAFDASSTSELHTKIQEAWDESGWRWTPETVELHIQAGYDSTGENSYNSVAKRRSITVRGIGNASGHLEAMLYGWVEPPHPLHEYTFSDKEGFLGGAPMYTQHLLDTTTLPEDGVYNQALNTSNTIMPEAFDLVAVFQQPPFGWLIKLEKMTLVVKHDSEYGFKFR